RRIWPLDFRFVPLSVGHILLEGDFQYQDVGLREGFPLTLSRAALVASLLLACVLPGAAADCQALLEQHRATDFKLPYQQFDQTMDSGFRVLAAAGCDKEAADLIEEYIRVNHATQNSLRWHVAQLRATQGDYAEAIQYARTCLTAKEDFAAHPLRWNDYVRATIAFLQHDRHALLQYRDRIALGKDYKGNAINLRLVDSLVRYFDKDYKYATSHIEP
ncbi:MAG TPA: hypothetical protein VFU76_01955, partial [Terriglobales bacterium]|nr:hypothetical protein [Terriglobales bacterium]